MKQKVVAVIPARYNSSRFPGKLLATIHGKSVLQRTFESVGKASCLDAICIATDDERIYEHARGFDAQVVMTSSACKNGTERLFDAISRYPQELGQYQLYVNIQGDEPCIPSSTIEQVVQLLQNNPHDVMATAIMPISSEEEFHHRGVVKCTINQEGMALYFSRAPIPYNNFRKAYKHVGIYAYRKEFLSTYAAMSPTPLQEQEDLEQLRVLEHGFSIRTVIVDTHSVSVDFPEDVKKVELCIQNLSS